MNITVKDSTEVPFTNGSVDIDTSNDNITIFITPGKKDDVLKLRKISSDKHIVILATVDCLINNNDTIIFGLLPHAKITKGKIKEIHLHYTDTWNIIYEN